MTRYYDRSKTVQAVECLSGGLPLNFLEPNEVLQRTKPGEFRIARILTYEVTTDGTIIETGRPLIARPGDMLLRHPGGELQIMDRDVFDQRYDEAPEPELPF